MPAKQFKSLSRLQHLSWESFDWQMYLAMLVVSLDLNLCLLAFTEQDVDCEVCKP